MVLMFRKMIVKNNFKYCKFVLIKNYNDNDIFIFAYFLYLIYLINIFLLNNKQYILYLNMKIIIYNI